MKARSSVLLMSLILFSPNKLVPARAALAGTTQKVLILGDNFAYFL
jgi:hypothetical protein